MSAHVSDWAIYEKRNLPRHLQNRNKIEDPGLQALTWEYLKNDKVVKPSLSWRWSL